MSAIANLAVYDGAATPVLHTLLGVSVSREADGSVKAIWKEGITTLPDYAQVRVTMVQRKLPSGVFRVSVRAEVPVMESIGSQNSSGYTAPPKVAYTDTVESVGYFHERGTVVGRRLARQLAVNVLNGITTSVTPTTTGPAPELFDQLVSAT